MVKQVLLNQDGDVLIKVTTDLGSLDVWCKDENEPIDEFYVNAAIKQHQVDLLHRSREE